MIVDSFAAKCAIATVVLFSSLKKRKFLQMQNNAFTEWGQFVQLSCACGLCSSHGSLLMAADVCGCSQCDRTAHPPQHVPNRDKLNPERSSSSWSSSQLHCVTHHHPAQRQIHLERPLSEELCPIVTLPRCRESLPTTIRQNIKKTQIKFFASITTGNVTPLLGPGKNQKLLNIKRLWLLPCILLSQTDAEHALCREKVNQPAEPKMMKQAYGDCMCCKTHLDAVIPECFHSMPEGEDSPDNNSTHFPREPQSNNKTKSKPPSNPTKLPLPLPPQTTSKERAKRKTKESETRLLILGLIHNVSTALLAVASSSVWMPTLIQ